MSFGERIKARRKELGWTLDDLAGRVDLSKSYLSELENGAKGIGAEALLRLATTLGTPMDLLFVGPGEVRCIDGATMFPAGLRRWAFDNDVPYRHASCLYWCARTILDHAPRGRRIEDWDWARFYEALKSWMEKWADDNVDTTTGTGDEVKRDRL